MSFVAIGGGIGLATSGYQIIKGAQDKKNAQERSKNLLANMPKYQGSAALDSYYNKALAESNIGAEQSALYKLQQKQSDRNFGAGLSAARESGMGLGSLSRLVQGKNDASLNALVAAAQQKERRFGNLGQASQIKASDDLRKFQINQQQPWQAQYSDVMAQGQAAAQQQQAGYQNAFNLLGSAATMGNQRYMAKNGYYKNTTGANRGGGYGGSGGYMPDSDPNASVNS